MVEFMRIHSTEMYIRMDVLNERQAQINHGQSLARLNERGGISAAEAMAIIERRKFMFIKEYDATLLLLKAIHDSKIDSLTGELNKGDA